MKKYSNAGHISVCIILRKPILFSCLIINYELINFSIIKRISLLTMLLLRPYSLSSTMNGYRYLDSCNGIMKKESEDTGCCNGIRMNSSPLSFQQQVPQLNLTFYDTKTDMEHSKTIF